MGFCLYSYKSWSVWLKHLCLKNGGGYLQLTALFQKGNLRPLPWFLLSKSWVSCWPPSGFAERIKEYKRCSSCVSRASLQLCVFAVPALSHPAALPLLLRVRQRREQRDPSPLEGGDAEAAHLPSTQRGEVEQRRQVRWAFTQLGNVLAIKSQDLLGGCTRVRANGLKLCLNGGFRLDVRKFYFSQKTLEQTVQGSGESPSLEMFRKLVDVSPEDMV